MPTFTTSLVWFRRDLRLSDHAALYYALSQSKQVHCVFIFDREILDPLLAEGLQADRRVDFIHAAIAELDGALRAAGGALIVRHAWANEEIPALARQLGVDAVFANHDYEPGALARDASVAAALRQQGQQLLTYKDQVIFEKEEVLSQAGRPFSVFTPYKNAWMNKLAGPDGDFYLKAYPVEQYLERLAAPSPLATALPTLEALGFAPTNLQSLRIPTGMSGASRLLEDFLPRLSRYGDSRDFPAQKGPSYLSVHLRFGTIAIRALARAAQAAIRAGQGGSGAAVWLGELIWRDFYFMILHHHPRVVEQSFKPAYDAIVWETDARAEQDFAAWCQGCTGYPLVDAAMLQLNQSGYMHNRLRMVTASFLTKDLGLDWRWGERYFAQQLNDFDLAANNGGWQWASSSGCDAQPYFRIFNPITQSEKFDADGKFIRRYLPQLARLPNKYLHAPWLAPREVLIDAGVTLGENYPHPVIDHADARMRTLARYAVVKQA
ncbi:deoxyribodipyrimidine photo-lyase [Herbaspirillum sp. Sphag1AN]|uniref:cryptochrome/photolyase family protein n=1 Tax=unclassified Herbaspirillum TaxID=2624150 RepID=UPI00160ED56F|nr:MULTISPECIES: deoxyribodipyrimidine photo-lyase [unclassified Herbaspirillum]MBB3211422.1 deoxyribodipyrimidine photo-lyase [Herbaspirillum sp. Sphag1AN]MBB3245311.1 deoxyribodipyrimidine photo-lyase [Herbaspirillum sp. Sphag64]